MFAVARTMPWLASASVKFDQVSVRGKIQTSSEASCWVDLSEAISR